MVIPKRAILDGLFAVLSLVVVILGWKYVWVTAIILVCLAAINILFIRTKSERKIALSIFLIGLLWGPLSEMSAILAGAWDYSLVNIAGMVPAWLFPLWGSAGLFFYSLTVGFQNGQLKLSDKD